MTTPHSVRQREAQWTIRPRGAPSGGRHRAGLLYSYCLIITYLCRCFIMQRYVNYLSFPPRNILFSDSFQGNPLLNPRKKDKAESCFEKRPNVCIWSRRSLGLAIHGATGNKKLDKARAISQGKTRRLRYSPFWHAI